MCLQPYSPPVDTACVSFDNQKFPTFSTISKCLPGTYLGSSGEAGHCYSQNPSTDISSGPVFCGNKIDSFFTKNGIIPIHREQSTIISAIQILVAHVE